METWFNDWAQLLVRWVHVLAAIAWIGHAFFFHTMEEELNAPEVETDPDVHGELWMVHGGGFFRMQKTRVLPRIFTGQLVWFKYEALTTWVSGALLLTFLYYLTGGVLMIDPMVAEIGVGTSIAIGIGTLVLGWIIYDMIWVFLGEQKALAYSLTVALVAASSAGLTQLLSGRAAFLHTGALLGTIMTANVWMRIIPGSKKMVAKLEKGEEPDLRYGKIGHQRSVHNGYMHFPIVFLMISNHYPFTYSHDYNWLIMWLMMILGASMRQLFYDGMGAHLATKGAVLGSLLGLGALTAPMPRNVPPPQPVVEGATAIDPATVGQIAGVISFDGEPPPNKELKLYGGCEQGRDGPLLDNAVEVNDGKVANAMIWIKSGFEDIKIPPAPETEVEVDQRGCVYKPRIHGARVGQDVTFINSDSMFHNVRTVSDKNEKFNLNMPGKDQRITQTFLVPEAMVQARCDVHPWMISWLGIMPHDWWSISDEQGRFTLQGVPPGEYEVEVWHEVFENQTATATVEASGKVKLDFTLATK